MKRQRPSPIFRGARIEFVAGWRVKWAHIERVKQQLSDAGLVPEDWGGHTLFVPVSALKRTGVKELLDAILLQAELLELKASYDCRAEGRIVDELQRS